LSSDYNTERERQVLELYNEGKTTREIAKEQRLSLRDISHILKKHGANHGIALIDDDDNKKSHSNNGKATQAYKLFGEGKTPVQVAIQLSLSEKEVTKSYMEYWRLKGIYGLYHIYQESKGNLSYFLKIYTLVKRQAITADNIEWFVNMVNIGTYNIPDLQKQYAKLQDEVQVIDHQKVVSKAELDNMNNQIYLMITFNY
jgi:DNA-binding CsgD family transcriptional regulator